jgi:hypothetical protein
MNAELEGAFHISEAQPLRRSGPRIIGVTKVWVAASVKESATLQACDLHKQCAVRELNPQPAD